MKTSVNVVASRLGLRIKKLRKAKGLTQEELGDAVNLDYKYISLLERGVRTPSVKALVRISDALDVEMKDFFDFHKSGAMNERTKFLNRIWILLQDRPKKDLELAERMLKSFLDG